MSPSLNGSSLIRRFEGSDAIEICNRISFDFYTGLPHICLWWVCEIVCENAVFLAHINVIVCVWMLFVVLVRSVFYMYVCACMWMWDGG